MRRTMTLSYLDKEIAFSKVFTDIRGHCPWPYPAEKGETTKYLIAAVAEISANEGGRER